MDILLTLGLLYSALSIVSEGIGALGRVDAPDVVTRSERLQNLYDVYFASRAAREVRHTAIGWKPGENWREVQGPTISGNREFYRIVRKGK